MPPTAATCSRRAGSRSPTTPGTCARTSKSARRTSARTRLEPRSGGGVAVTEHAVVIAGGGPTGLMLAAELTLAGVDVVVVERRGEREPEGARGGGLHARTIEVLDQRGIADRFLAEGQVAQVAAFAGVRLELGDFPSRHPYGLRLWQDHIERILDRKSTRLNSSHTD